MRIGIVADIHDSSDILQIALEVFAQRKVDQVVTLGDAFDSMYPGDPGAEVAQLLSEANAIGVWGNHDVGLSHEVSPEVRASADPELLSYAARLRPQLAFSDCLFSHIEPWRDPTRIDHLWAYDGVPRTKAQVEMSFHAVTEPYLFVGHFHTWFAVGEKSGVNSWDGTEPLRLSAGDRYFIGVAAVVDGYCAIFDTFLREITPIHCSVVR